MFLSFFTRTATGFALLLGGSVPAADWTLSDGANPEVPGRRVDIKEGDRTVARFIYGEGQIKPFLHVFGDDGDLLTAWDPKQQFPHHRGIFIGWNKISSDLGTFDLWHFNNGGKMIVTKLEQLNGGPNQATLVARIEWRGGKTDAGGSDLLLVETRTLTVSRPATNRVQVDVGFRLQATRDLTLGGDLQHSGIHFRGHSGLTARHAETSYLWSPAELTPTREVISSPKLQWCRLEFPLGEHWYATTELNAPANPVEQLSTRDYGRFGFFFKRSLKKDEMLPLQYRFLLDRTEAPGDGKKLSNDQAKQARETSQADYEAFARSLAASSSSTSILPAK